MLITAIVLFLIAAVGGLYMATQIFGGRRPSGGIATLHGVLAASALIIVGWVVMWHPLEVLIYGGWPVVRERLLQRLAAADVHVSTGLGRPAAAAR